MSTERYGASHLSTLLDAEHVSCRKHLWPEIVLLPGLLSNSAFPCQDTHFQMLHEQQQNISMCHNVRGLTQVPLVNTFYSRVQSFWGNGVSSVITVTLTQVLRRT